MTTETASPSTAASKLIASSDPYVTDPFFPLQQASQEILAALRADESSPDADLFRKIAHSSNSYDTSVSAASPQRQGFEYRVSPSTAAFLNKSTAFPAAPGSISVQGNIEHRQSIPLPQHLANTLATETKLFNLMGTFPDAHLVWVTVDNTLYLWEYESQTQLSRQDYVAFSVPSGQCIVSVGLVPPKPGVFTQAVEWCIVVTTPEEVLLCALARTAAQAEQMPSNYDSVLRLIPTSFILSTDSVPILSVQGTRDGRILLGGYDGCIYEMVYEGLITGNSDGGATKTTTSYNMQEGKDYYYYCVDEQPAAPSTPSVPAVLWSESMKLTSAILTGTKRTLTQWALGNEEGHTVRARKCRKINHTSFTPSILQALVPSFILKAATSALSFASSSFHFSNAGPIIQLVMDHDRRVLYALTQRGFVHAFSVLDASSNQETIHYACSVDLAKSAHRYLDNVARAKPFPPTLPFSADTEAIAAIIYPGGASAAAAGVGGMDNARFLLKIADEQGLEEAAKSKSRQSNKYGYATILHPISIHVIQPSASQSLTLVAVTAGGLRYYVSVLPNVASSFHTSFTRDETLGSKQLGRRFTLAHIRSPPPFRLPRTEDEFQDLSLGSNIGRDAPSGAQVPQQNCIQPGPSRQGTLSTSVSRALYWEGFTWLAVDIRKGRIEDSNTHIMGDSIVTLSPDSTLRNPVHVGSTSISSNQLLSGSGLAEIVCFPTVECRSNAHESSILGGGHIWDFSGSSHYKRDLEGTPYSSVHRLIIHSNTPSDTELAAGIISPFIAPSPQPPPTKAIMNTPKPISWQFHQQRPQSLLFSGVGLLTSQILQRLSQYANQKSRESNPKSIIPRKYRISLKAGCSTIGFDHASSLPRLTSPQTPSRKTAYVIAERLPSWLICPRETTLPGVSFQHPALSSHKSHVVALNSGGVHIFSECSPVDKLKDILANINVALVGIDEKVQSYFFNYGFMEACVMCLSVAITSDSDEVKSKAIQAALRYAHRPTMIRDPATSWVGDASISSSNPEKLTFQPSYLYRSLLTYSSRLLRPVWYKPAIVVTEGKPVYAVSDKSVMTIPPAKVELLLDDITLHEIRTPLVSLQNIIRIIFNPIIESVPDSPVIVNGESTTMIINSQESITSDSISGLNLLTRAMYKSRVNALNREAGPAKLTDSDILQIAKLTEERKIHSLYRLLSRTVQVLTLMSQLRKAHSTPELPGVEFGLLHGLTFCQLVTTKSAHERIDIILSNLLSASLSSEATVDMASIESSNFATVLGNECYLLFSSACRFTFLGFKLAHEALKQPSLTVHRKDLSEKAGLYLRKAAFQWTNVELISGILLHGSDDNVQIGIKSLLTDMNFTQIAMRALERSSPLARAASILMDLEEVTALVDVCLICARNFGSKKEAKNRDMYAYLDETAEIKDVYPWEKDLYHQYPSANDNVIQQVESNNFHPSAVKNPSPSGAAVVGVEVTQTDALTTCYAVLFHYMLNALSSLSQTASNSVLVDAMLSTAASSSDIDFLHLLYEFLIMTDHVEKLLRIESVNLAQWLRLQKKDLLLLWRHFTFHGLHSMAGQVMLERARSAEKNISLEDRVESLTRAVNSFAAALEHDHVPINFDYSPLSQNDLRSLITQTNEGIEIALLQKRIVDRLDCVGVKYDETILFSLLSVSDLYNDYAVPNSLYDLCLLIMHVCEYKDYSTAATLWKSIFCEEILPCKTRNPDVVEFLDILKDGSMYEHETVALIVHNVEAPTYSALKWFEQGEWIPSLKTRIGSLGKELNMKVSDITFPLTWIIETLNGLQRVFISTTQGSTLSTSETLWSEQFLCELGLHQPLMSNF